MEPSIAFRVLYKLVPLVIILTAIRKVGFALFLKIVVIDEITSGIIRGVNIDKSDFPQIGFLQEFQNV